jgi:superfamily II DNA/RNA helicase
VTTTFSDLGVDAGICSRLESRGIAAPFPVQAATIPASLEGRDVVAKAPTGSGKTLAFGVAAIESTRDSSPRRPRGLILEPTRELAAQVRDELGSIMEGGTRRIIAIYGGTRYGPAQAALNKGVDILVACPGRLEDLIEQGMVDLSEVCFVVIDEADRMADMGFLPVVRRILDQTESDRQVLLFSATMGKEIEGLATSYLRDPARVEVEGDDEASGDVTHYFWAVTGDQRMTQCASVINQLGQAIVFCRTRRGADRVARQLEAEGIKSVAIHGDRSQAQRERALKAFERGEAQALVATDVAARGIHLEALPGVIHFDPPADATDYTHRSGRTGRAGCDGIVISMVVSDQKRAVGNIQKALGLQRVLTEPVVLDVEPRIPTPPKRDPRRERGARDQVREDREPRRGGRDERPQRQSREDRWPKRRSDDGAPRSERPRREGSWDRPNESRESHGGRGPTGIVKFYNADKGYGFVARQGQDDLFVHASGLPASVNGRLEEGQIVAFEIGKGKRGDEARNVRIVSGAKSGSSRDKRPMAAAGKRKGRN